MQMQDKKLEVSAIENGTVIDHIPANALFKVISILNLDKMDRQQITFGTNFDSKKLGKKAIVKLSDVFFKDKDINKIALVAPQAKLNIIRNYKVVEKKIVEVPEDIIGIAKCMNPKCISNNEKIVTKFRVVSRHELRLKCHYCEKITDQEHMEII
jgi:aspartate carbamoyltransferase regulatory subunit